MKQNLLPPPLWLNTHDPKVGLRLQLLFDADKVLRLAVVLSVDGQDWVPFYAADPEEAHQHVRALFTIMDCYGPCSARAQARVEAVSEEDVWSFDERDDTPEDNGD